MQLNLMENLVEEKIVIRHSQSEYTLRRMKYNGKSRRITFRDDDPSRRGISALVSRDGTYFEFRMMHQGQSYFKHLGSVHAISLVDAKNLASIYRDNIANGRPIDYQSKQSLNLTFKDAYEAYINSEKFLQLKPRYQEVFKLKMKKYVIGVLGQSRNNVSGNTRPLLGQWKLTSIDKTVASEYWSNLTQSHDGKNKERGASIVKSHCSVIFDYARQHLGFHGDNPFKFSVPNVMRLNEQHPFSPEELGYLINAFANQPPPFKQFFNICLLTGWRNGEVARMKWRDILPARPVSFLTHNDKRTVNVWSVPKDGNKSSRRIDYILTEAMMKQISSLPKFAPITQAKNQFIDSKSCIAGEELEYVFASTRAGAGGKQTHLSSPKKRMRNILTEIGISKTQSLHNLRHTFVTMMTDEGFSRNSISRFHGKIVNEGAASFNVYDSSSGIEEKLRVAEGWETILRRLGFV